ncbi:MAG TPA: response regulator [Acidimicrobiales bacterium]|nr:response regulator [Acidimicrobiales bacterium]
MTDGAAAVGSAVRVLVVDDDPVILKLLRVNFEMEGYSVITAADGLKGLKAARKERPDVIISDVMMPHMNGLELVAALDADASTDTIPVILLSARAQETDVSDGLHAGADDYVTKPFDPIELIDRVQRLLARP